MKTTPTATAQVPSRTYFRPTTLSQRELLFNTAEQTDNVSAAADRAHVSRGIVRAQLNCAPIGVRVTKRRDSLV